MSKVAHPCSLLSTTTLPHMDSTICLPNLFSLGLAQRSALSKLVEPCKLIEHRAMVQGGRFHSVTLLQHAAGKVTELTANPGAPSPT
eukprot:scaffold29601_cov34-Tisochrysis_lutea.AAC.4